MEFPVGIYIHVPFCLQKCPYCDFYSIRYDSMTADSYTDAVCRAISGNPYQGRTADTVYFGGGTPVLLGARNLEKILTVCAGSFQPVSPEITVEANPAAGTQGLWRDLRAAGFNRVSFGVQSAVDAELSELGRLHDAKTAKAGILAACQAGFSNISADLMLGIPLQTRESLADSISFLNDLPVSHISAYLLKIEAGTAFCDKGLATDEDLLAALYLDCVEFLSKAGFRQYEISNFAKKAAVSRHNLKYWNCEEYLGFGPASHSFIDGKRFFFPRDISGFIKADDPFALTVPDGGGGGFEEYAMLRLRLCDGLDLNRAASRYGADVDAIAKKAEPLQKNGLLTVKNGVIALTPRGFLVSNSVTAALLW